SSAIAGAPASMAVAETAASIIVIRFIALPPIVALDAARPGEPQTERSGHTSRAADAGDKSTPAAASQ
ncbi:MAG: hypothetical protein J0H08_08590, partial [Rhizobiales bacterium]|nr:hypothetical protein [Hyphomicrobiales bacterium]